MTIVLSALLLVSVFVNAWCFRALADAKTREARLQARFEDGEAVGRLPREDTPISLLRIRQDR